MDALGGHYAKWNKSNRGGEWCIISLICGIFKQYSKLVNITKKQTHRYRDELIITRKVKELWSCHVGKKDYCGST